MAVACLFGCGGSSFTYHNDPPRINSLQANGQSVTAPNAVTVTEGSMVVLAVQAKDPNGDPLTYQWNNTGGTLTSTNSQIETWTAPMSLETDQVTCTVTDGRGGVTSQSILLHVVKTLAPLQAALTPATATVAPGGTQAFDCTVTNGDNTPLTYQYLAAVGAFAPDPTDPTNPAKTIYTAPTPAPAAGTTTVYCIVRDSATPTSQTATASATVTIQAPATPARKEL